MDNRAMKMAMARKAGRAMGASASPDMMGRAMVRPGMGAAPGMKKGGETKEMMKKEVSFMKKKGAPKSMIKHEEAEYGMKKGGMAKSGGSFRRAADGIASKGKTKGKMVKMAYGGKC
jgi:hypothetical protein